MRITMKKKPLAIAMGAAFALTGMAAQASVFQTADLGAGYMVVSAGEKGAEGKCGEGKCGEGKCGAKKADKKTEGKCGEGKCGEGMFKKMDSNGDGALSKDEFMAGHKKAEGKCGEGKCGEGKCGAKKK